MKKKVRKYAEGGEPKFERGTYELAREMLRNNTATAGEPTPSLDDRIARAREMIEGVRQSASEPAPSRSAPRPASNAETIDADMGRAMQSAAVRSRIIPSAPTAADRNDADEGANLRREMQSAEVSVPSTARSLTPQRPDAAARQALDSLLVQAQDKHRELEAKARGRERERQAKEDEIQMVKDRGGPGPARSRAPQNVMGVRAAQQMEEKGSIFSPDYGLSRAEREAKKEREERERVAKREAEARERRSGTRETTRAEVRNSRSATPPVPPPGTRAFANRRRRDLAGPAMTGSPGFKSGGMVGSASKRADGIAQKGKTKGRLY